MTASARDLDLRQHHGIETPEHVDVQFELAGVGSRLAAGLLDLLLLVLGLLALWIGGGTIILTFCFLWGYFTLFEALNGGRTPGKQALGIRVVMDTGRSITPSAAVVRNLVRFIDCYFPVPFAPALISMFLHPSNKRPGDMAAGTIVVRDHPPTGGRGGGAPVPAEESAEPLEAGPPELSEEEFRLLDRFLGRINDLTPEVLVRITTDLVRRFERRIPRRSANGAAGLPRAPRPVPPAESPSLPSASSRRNGRAGKRSARRRSGWSGPASGPWRQGRSPRSPPSTAKWPPISRGRAPIRSIPGSSPTWSGSSPRDTMRCTAPVAKSARPCPTTFCATFPPRSRSPGGMFCSPSCYSRFPPASAM